MLTVPRKDNPEIVDRLPIKKDTQVVLDFIGYSLYSGAVLPSSSKAAHRLIRL